jgi:Ca2+-transporting ATPase
LGDVFSKSFVFIAICILAGQYLIVNYAGQFFHVSPLSGNDWLTLIIITCPVLLVGEIIRIARMARNGMLFN